MARGDDGGGQGGYNPDYYFRQMGGKDAQAGDGRGPDYDLSAAEQGGGPEGHWGR